MTATAEEIKAVGKLRRPQDLPALADWLATAPTPEARAQAAACLGWQRSPAATPPLSAAARSDSAPEVRAAALRALCTLKDPGAARVLDASLADPDPICRSLALRLAGLLGVARPEVRAAVDDPAAPDAVAMEACLAAGRLGDPAVAPALWARFEAVAPAGAPASAESVRRAAGMAWCQLASPAQAPRVVALLADPDADLRVAAMGALERLEHPDAASLIAPLRTDPHPAVRRVAAAIHNRLG